MRNGKLTSNNLSAAGKAAIDYFLVKPGQTWQTYSDFTVEEHHMDMINRYKGTLFWRASQAYAAGDKIRGMQATGFILDDPAGKPRKKDYNTIGVRFIYGHSLDKIYTYRIRKGAKVHLGQELIAPSSQGTKVVVCVRIDKKPTDTGVYDYKFITQKAASL